jgi:REP element-mobilizing transposase RayT
VVKRSDTTGQRFNIPSHPGRGASNSPVMASTYTCLLYHIIFSTKHREPAIAPAWRNRLHEYLGGAVRGLGGTPQGVGGVADHVHLLIGLKPTHCLSDFIRELKKSSSSWVSRTMRLPAFEWQVGYAGLTVSASLRPDVQKYIASQEEHHRGKSFRAELIEFLEKAGIDFDERYLD